MSKIQKNEFHSGFQSFFCLGVIETAASYKVVVTVDVTAVVTARHRNTITVYYAGSVAIYCHGIGIWHRTVVFLTGNVKDICCWSRLRRLKVCRLWCVGGDCMVTSNQWLMASCLMTNIHICTGNIASTEFISDLGLQGLEAKSFDHF